MVKTEGKDSKKEEGEDPLKTAETPPHQSKATQKPNTRIQKPTDISWPNKVPLGTRTQHNEDKPRADSTIKHKLQAHDLTQLSKSFQGLQNRRTRMSIRTPTRPIPPSTLLWNTESNWRTPTKVTTGTRSPKTATKKKGLRMDRTHNCYSYTKHSQTPEVYQECQLQ